MIQKYFNLFSNEQIDRIWKYLHRPKWEFWQRSLDSDNQNYFWYMDFNKKSFFREELFEIIKNNIGKKFIIDKVYANGQTFGLDGNFHIDDIDDNGYTFLYYPMKKWNFEWGGETIFLGPDINYDYASASANTELAIQNNSFPYHYTPIPNSGILFPGKLIHMGKSPSIAYKDLRVTIAYKLKKLI